MKKVIIGLGVLLMSCNSNKKSDLLYYDLKMRIVNFDSDCSLSNDKFKNPRLCNAVLFETLDTPKRYLHINTCNLFYKVHIDIKWIYNHNIGDTVHFDYLLKERFFNIKNR